MELREFFDKDAINLDLKGETKDEILKELITLLDLDEKSEAILFKMLKRRENLGSTGIGEEVGVRDIAIAARARGRPQPELDQVGIGDELDRRSCSNSCAGVVYAGEGCLGVTCRDKAERLEVFGSAQEGTHLDDDVYVCRA